MIFYRIKEKYFKQYFLLQDNFKVIGRYLSVLMTFIFAVVSLFYVFLFISHFGFQDEQISKEINYYAQIILYLLFYTSYLSEILVLRKRNKKQWIIDGFIFMAFLAVVLYNIDRGTLYLGLFGDIFNFVVINVAILFLIITRLSFVFQKINAVKVDPALLIVLSFLFMIFLGSGLLMLPKAQAQPLSYFQSLFTSVSAVCVTGLTVVDVNQSFTELGRLIIICLIQIGGLGIMTFTGFFGYFFTGSATFKDRLLIKEMVSSDAFDGLFKILMQIIIITFLIEFIGACVIYSSLGNDFYGNKILFSVFHSISAFCNAGFSTVEGGMTASFLQGNTVFIVTIGMLIIFGGLGFPVILILLKTIRNVFAGLFPGLKREKLRWHPLRNNINYRIVLYSTAIFLVSGTVVYFFLEKNNSLQGISVFKQWLISFFGSVSARTAGFNIVDMTKWTTPTVFFMMFLMWVGASPGSTGGGIKTTTFFLAIKTCVSFIRGRSSLQIGNREIGRETLIRVMVIIILSFVFISISYFFLLITDKDKNPVNLLFETFSAFGTVGLSIVDTSVLSHGGQSIIMVLMFLGRLGPLTVMSGMFLSEKKQYFKYPKQNLVIN
ncbi:MAG: hypothetical protein JJE45_06565 [Prolixibacteraceae bacterium]|nr:hypothetical protein [Prolixibacteraceae bacterium]